MFFNANKHISPTNLDDNEDNGTEKVYVDWPEGNSEDYRFVSSRMDDIESDFHPLIAADDIKNVTRNLSDLKLSNKPPSQANNNKRYEDLSRKQEKLRKNSTIPPLDLISQHSSIEIPGAKGAIDIDFRSISDSLSDEYDNREDNIDVERDSLNDNLEKYSKQNNDIYYTTLPQVTHEDLVINPGEYNSSRHSHNVAISRRFSDITIPSQYRPVAPIEPNYSQYENEQAAFESIQQRYKQNLSSDKHQMTAANSVSKSHKPKPTLHVAPQIKQPLNEKAPNFIELNKVTFNQQKPINQTSYANKFADRQRKDSPTRTVKMSAGTKEIPPTHFNNADKTDRNPTLSTKEYWNKRERSIERLTGDHREYREYRDDDLDQMQRQMYAPGPANVIYAYTKYGEPLIINTNDLNYPTNIQKSSDMVLHQPIHASMPEYPPPTNMLTQNSINALVSPRVQRSNHFVQEMRRSVDSDHTFQDAPYKRQPTLYDEKLLEKKTRIASSERIGSHLPPLPGSSDSNYSQNMGNGYSSNLRKKEVNYEQYTLRDFKNIKQINTVGGLGPNLGTESHKQMREKMIRQKNYSKAVKEKNQELLKTNENKDHSVIALRADKISHNDNEEASEIDIIDIQESSSQAEEKSEKMKPKSTFSSANSKVREQVAKRDLMISYSKAIKEKQIKKQISKSKLGGSQSEISKKDTNRSQEVGHELFNNSDLERLLQRHEHDKRMTDQIRQKWEKTN